MVTSKITFIHFFTIFQQRFGTGIHVYRYQFGGKSVPVNYTSSEVSNLEIDIHACLNLYDTQSACEFPITCQLPSCLHKEDPQTAYPMFVTWA